MDYLLWFPPHMGQTNKNNNKKETGCSLWEKFIVHHSPSAPQLYLASARLSIGKLIRPIISALLPCQCHHQNFQQCFVTFLHNKRVGHPNRKTYKSMHVCGRGANSLVPHFSLVRWHKGNCQWCGIFFFFLLLLWKVNMLILFHIHLQTWKYLKSWISPFRICCCWEDRGQ